MFKKKNVSKVKTTAQAPSKKTSHGKPEAPMAKTKGGKMSKAQPKGKHAAKKKSVY